MSRKHVVVQSTCKPFQNRTWIRARCFIGHIKLCLLLWFEFFRTIALLLGTLRDLIAWYSKLSSWGSHHTHQVRAQSHKPKVHFAFGEMPSKISLIASRGHKACWDKFLSYIPEQKQKEDANRTSRNCDKKDKKQLSMRWYSLLQRSR